MKDDYVKFNDKIYPYTVSLTMDLIGGKWKAVILYHLIDGKKPPILVKLISFENLLNEICAFSSVNCFY